MTEKTFTVAGVSTLEGKTKVRFANDMMRIKLLTKKNHTDIDFIDLPHAMTKAEVGAYLNSIDFADGRPAVQEAIDDLVKKNPVAKVEAVEETAEAELA